MDTKARWSNLFVGRLWNLATDAQPNLSWPGGTMLMEVADGGRL